MLIGWVKLRGLTVLATFVFALLAIAVFPEIANAHGKANPTALSTENVAYENVDAGHVNEPTLASSHCHSSIGQDCSTQIGFLVASHILVGAVGYNVSTPVYSSLPTGWLLPFDPPPPRVLSRD